MDDISDHDDGGDTSMIYSKDVKLLRSQDVKDPKIIVSKGGYGKPQSQKVVEQEIQQPIFKVDTPPKDVIKPKVPPLELKHN